MVRDRVRVRVLLAFSCLPIACSANPQSAVYPWPVIERYDTSCSYVYTLGNTTYITKSAALTDGSSSLWSFVIVEWIYSLKTDMFCTIRCLATVSNNSATTPFCLLVITNGRQEVHARTLTSVCKKRIVNAAILKVTLEPLGELFWSFKRWLNACFDCLVAEDIIFYLSVGPKRNTNPSLPPPKLPIMCQMGR